jgi:NitT/TauT family transport system ATP-binding protein
MLAASTAEAVLADAGPAPGDAFDAHAAQRAAAQADARPVRIETRNLCKQFSLGSNTFTVVDDVSISVRKGEFVSLLGPSGCGKSTILNMIAGLTETSQGEIRIDGEPAERSRGTSKLGYIFQKDTCYPWRTVEQNIGIGLELAKVPEAERRPLIAEAIRNAGLGGFERAFPSMLSGGMRQRVSLMRSLIMKPEILLMDEPFGALDTHTKLEIHKVLLQSWESQRQTVMFVTHDLSEALTLSDRIILLSARPGRVKQIFDIDFPRPRDPIQVRELPAYAEAFSEIWHSLGEEFRKGKAE